MITLNGKPNESYKDLSELLLKNGYRREIIAVEINGKIVKKTDYDQTAINDGDVVEVVQFMGGG